MSGKYNSNTSTMSSQQANTLDGLVFDYYRLAVDAILKDRKARMNPIIASSQVVSAQSQPASLSVGQPIDHTGYINNTLQGWRKSLTKPMTLDIYLFHSQLQKHILIERWNFTYHQHNDFSQKTGGSSSSAITSSSSSSSPSSNRIYATVNRRIQTLVRSLYCFVRLLPGFNLLHLSPIDPFLSFQIYDSKQTMTPSQFYYEPAKQNFPVIATTKGKLATTIHFINPMHVMEIIKALNGGAIIGPLPGMILPEHEASPSASKTASIPIPIAGDSGSSSKRDFPSDARVPRSYHDDPYRRSFQRQYDPADGGHVRSFELNLPDALARMNQHHQSQPHYPPIDLQQPPPALPSTSFNSSTQQTPRNRESFDGGEIQQTGGSFGGGMGTAVAYSFGSTPRSSFSQNTPPFAQTPIQDEYSPEGGRSLENMMMDHHPFNGPSPPQFSGPSSLQSTSPHTAMIERRHSHRLSRPSSQQIAGSWGSKTATFLHQQHIPHLLREYDQLRPKISLPTSPFLFSFHHNASTNSSSNNSDNSQVAALTTTDTESLNSNKLDFLVQLEREKERRLSEIFIDGPGTLGGGTAQSTYRNRSISGLTEVDQPGTSHNTRLFLADLAMEGNKAMMELEEVEEELPFALPPGNQHDIASSIYGLTQRHSHSQSYTSTSSVGALLSGGAGMMGSGGSSALNESSTYYSLAAVSGELLQKLNEFKDFRSTHLSSSSK